jgi:hypothetical protein
MSGTDPGTVVCAKCGADVVRRGGVEPKPDDPIVCPNCGPIGTHKTINEQIGKQFARKAADSLKEVFRKSGFEVE